MEFVRTWERKHGDGDLVVKRGEMQSPERWNSFSITNICVSVWKFLWYSQWRIQGVKDVNAALNFFDLCIITLYGHNAHPLRHEIIQTLPYFHLGYTPMHIAPEIFLLGYIYGMNAQSNTAIIQFFSKSASCLVQCELRILPWLIIQVLTYYQYNNHDHWLPTISLSSVTIL